MDPLAISDAPSGTKRRADGALEAPKPAQRIRALDPDVVNKIAAGEIIISPVHALKELLENSVDAGATRVEILVKDGGLRTLQVTDNGSGIQKDDLEMLCMRHTTSKISTFEDLSSLATYGFRGEALASISHIAQVLVRTRTEDDHLYAWRVKYQDGKLVPGPGGGDFTGPRAVPGPIGTQIRVEHMFYNVPIRQKACRSHAEEFRKIVDMAGRYAVHCEGVGFSCKKAHEVEEYVPVDCDHTVPERIRHIYGSNVSKELIELSVSARRWVSSAKGYFTSSNYHTSKTTLLLFINHRCVESSTMKKALERTYTSFLPKGGRPFIYLSLEIDPARVDVNIHPTKREVQFLNEGEVIQAICNQIESQLAAVDASRTFLAQLSGAKPVEPLDEDAGNAAPKFTTPALRKVRRNSNELVRTDKSQGKITAMFTPAGPAGKGDSPAGPVDKGDSSAGPAGKGDSPAGPAGKGDSSAGALEDEPYAVPQDTTYTTRTHEPAQINYTSIRELRKEVDDDINEELTKMIASHTFVGVLDETRRIVAIQVGVKLYLVDYGSFCCEFFYQRGLKDFGNFGVINLEPPPDLTEIIEAGIQMLIPPIEHRQIKRYFDWCTETVKGVLVRRREMLKEYFNLEITPDGKLVSIPLLIKEYSPTVRKLGVFLCHLGRVEWSEEKTCFQMILKELAMLYIPEPLPTSLTGKWAKSFSWSDGSSVTSGERSSPFDPEDDDDDDDCWDFTTPMSWEFGPSSDAGVEGPDHEKAQSPTWFRRSAESEGSDAGDGGQVMTEEEFCKLTRIRRQNVRYALEYILFPAFKKRLTATNQLMEKSVKEVADLKKVYKEFQRC
ncbi:hypothetical protein THARTR1_07140 [Trichoderma harzianum]|uniref:DNA mismatch repair protein S5 domain-containing protein n=1 Tax=Trichoderma harzianum TaxID=5544 RepID=A0A2K0U2C9_TRIHA|nr:hypothetical protein THARTR1_07140 [Trichoderma harzianum]